MNERDKNPIVAVCENEALVYGDANEKTGVRPLRRIERFFHRGHALQYAVDFEAPKEKKKAK